MEFSIRGQAIIVLDGSTEHGKSLVRFLLSEGASVIQPEAVGNLTGQGIASVPCEPSNRQGARDLIDAAAQQFGRLDAVIMNRRRISAASIESSSLEEASAALNEVCRSAFMLTQEGGAYWTEHPQARGRLIYLSSLHYEKTNGCDYLHSMTMGAINNLMREAALHYGQYGVTANLIAFGPRSEDELLFANNHTSFYDGMQYKLPAMNYGQEHDLHSFIIYLLSSSSSFMNGADIRMDGAATLAYTNAKANHRALMAQGGCK